MLGVLQRAKKCLSEAGELRTEDLQARHGDDAVRKQGVAAVDLGRRRGGRAYQSCVSGCFSFVFRGRPLARRSRHGVFPTLFFDPVCLLFVCRYDYGIQTFDTADVRRTTLIAPLEYWYLKNKLS